MQLRKINVYTRYDEEESAYYGPLQEIVINIDNICSLSKRQALVNERGDKTSVMSISMSNGTLWVINQFYKNINYWADRSD